MKLRHLPTILLLIITLTAKAQITTDGTLGHQSALAGPDYQIGADLGSQMGGNLFHSFQDFNLNRLESATFSGPNSVQNIIGRVTGGNPSNIDGLIRSTIPSADMYFLNPYGIMFGPHARLDVQGSFHASTADYLRFGNGGRFDARQPSGSLLTVAPVEAFGFLTDNPAPIHFQGSQLRVLPEKELTIVGGDFTMEQASISAQDGAIKIASVASQGEVILLESDLLVSSFDDLGDISISGDGNVKGNSVLNVTGDRAGSVFIRGENLSLSNRGFITANTNGNTDETGPIKGINIKLSGQMKLIQTSDIEAKTFGSGQTAPIMIEVDRLELREGSQITSNVWHSGQGNHLTIKANEIMLFGLSEMMLVATSGTITRNASGIASTSHTSNLSAAKSIVNVEAKHLVIENHAQINVASTGLGDAGSINIKVEHLEIITGGILSTTVGEGDGGSIHIEADKIRLSEVGSINSSGLGPGTGKAGDIIIKANNIELINGGNVNISTLGFGKSGAINIKVSDTLRLSGQANESQFYFYDFVNEQTGGLLPKVGVKPEDVVGSSKISAAVIHFGPESAGRIDIEAGRLLLQNAAKITGEHRGMGAAGEISIRASDIRLTQGTITTETFGGGGGGNITLNSSNLLYLHGSDITTSVGTGKGQGGEISIENPTFVVLDQGQIKAQADEGQGGNIRIKSKQFIGSPDSLISASSRLGLDGEVKIESPEVDISGALLLLPAAFVDASAQLKPPCTVARRRRNKNLKNSFVVKRFNGSPPSPDDFQSNRLVLLPSEDEQGLQLLPRAKYNYQTAGNLALMAGCRLDLSLSSAR